MKIVVELVERSAPEIVIEKLVCVALPRLVNLEELTAALYNQRPSYEYSFSTGLRNEIIHRLGLLNVWNPLCPGAESYVQ